MKRLTLIAVMSSLVGCATTTLPPAGIAKSYQHVGVSIISPDEGDWSLMQHTDSSVVFGKQYPSKSETAIANTQIFWVGALDSDEEFFEKMIVSRKTSSNDARFKQLSLDYEALIYKERPCLKYSGVAEDHGTTGIESSQFQYFKNAGYICRSNLNETTAILMEVSHRSPSKAMPDNLRTVAAEFFDAIVLTVK